MKTTVRISLVTALLSFIGTVSAGAQEFPEDNTSERLEKIENIVSKLPKISGFLNLRYQWSDNDAAHTFDLRRARVDLKGDIGKKFDYRLQVEFASNPRILDAYFRWKINPYVNLQAGQFKIPFTIENSYGPHTLETIENSMAVSRLCGYDENPGINSNGRDIGLQIYGGFLPRNGYNLIDYALGVFNGNGINGRDNNNSKDFAGIVTVHPARYLGVSLTHYNGCYGESGSTSQRVRTGAGALYDDGRLLVRGEYIHGKTGRQKSEGWYAVAAYHVLPKLQPLLKYDHFQQNKSDKDTKRTNFIAGINYFPIKYVRLQLNYTYAHIRRANDVNTIAFQVFGLF